MTHEARPPAELVERHVQRIRAHLAQTGTWITAWRKVDPADQVDAAAARETLGAALCRLNVEQQQSTGAAGVLPPFPLRWGDATALRARAQHYADGLLVSWDVACLLATTPLPVSWVAQVFDQLQLRTINARVRGRENRLVRKTWALLAMAADGLAGTGQLPAPHLAWRWCDVFLPLTSVPATNRMHHAGDRDDQDARVLRQAYWDAAEELAGSTHDGGMPVERFVPAREIRQALREISGVNWWGSSGRRFDALTRRSRQHLPRQVRASSEDWRRTMLDETAKRLAVRVPGWRPSWHSKPGHMRRWFLAGDLAQRCRATRARPPSRRTGPNAVPIQRPAVAPMHCGGQSGRFWPG